MSEPHQAETTASDLVVGDYVTMRNPHFPEKAATRHRVSGFIEGAGQTASQTMVMLDGCMGAEAAWLTRVPTPVQKALAAARRLRNDRLGVSCDRCGVGIAKTAGTPPRCPGCRRNAAPIANHLVLANATDVERLIELLEEADLAAEHARRV